MLEKIKPMKKVKCVTASGGKKKGKKELKKKEQRISLKGSEKAGYVLRIVSGVWSDDIQITHEELRELYIILERKFGEFIGYKIK